MVNKLYRAAVLLIFVALGVAGAFAYNTIYSEPTYSGAAQLIGSDTVAELTTQRIVTKAIMNRDHGGTLLGADETLAYGTVTLSYGIDLEQAHFVRNDEAIGGFDVSLPAMKLISAEIDESTVVMDRDATGLNRMLRSSDIEIASEMRAALKEEADNFVRSNGGLPEHGEMERRVKKLFLDIGVNHTMIEDLGLSS